MTGLIALAVRHRSFLVLLAMAIVAGTLWVRGERAIADRDQVVAIADGICASAASNWRPSGAKLRDRGKACRAAVTNLAAFKTGAIAETNTLLVQNESDRAVKSETDLKAAIAAANRTAGAARRMEEANAKIAPDDRVDGDWFVRLNDLAGLWP